MAQLSQGYDEIYACYSFIINNNHLLFMIALISV